MGNRAVIVSHDTNKMNADKKIGIYLHWNGSRGDVESFLSKAKEKGIRTVDRDPCYFWARFAQVIGDCLSASGENETDLGIGIVSRLDTHNCDNGVYYIKDFEIVNHTDGSEFD